MIGACSRKLSRVPLLEAFLGDTVSYVWPGRGLRFSAFAGWGAKASGQRAERLAERYRTGCLRLEDGFLRSFGLGKHFPPLALVVDELGIYYDATRPSSLEQMLESERNLLDGCEALVDEAWHLILEHGLSKYNHAPDLDSGLAGDNAVERVLVVDQTRGDLSVTLGGGSAQSFADMLTAALDENPHARIYVKTHPEVSSGHKGGYLTDLRDDARVVVLRETVSPMSLLRHMDKVYVVTSQLGFEAMLAGKPVTCFGTPYYAGWGATDDRLSSPRRTRARTTREIFAAAYVHYSRYLDPVTHAQGSILDVIDFLIRQRVYARTAPGRTICVGFPRWRQYNLGPILSLNPNRVVFCKDSPALAEVDPGRADRIVLWGRTPPAGVETLAQEHGSELLRMEDGFVRSVGLGSDLIRPQSVVLDARGIYFDPGQESDLEHMLNHAEISDAELMRARTLRVFIQGNRITKYNIDSNDRLIVPDDRRQVVLVPGQVEDDASIQYGCAEVRTNLELLKATRARHPDAWIVYKPHPDVVSRNRRGSLAWGEAQGLADQIETRLSVVSCIEASDVVHTMTSLTGFDALLRGKQVVVYGRPFYSGWGVTDDVLTPWRRDRTRTLDELVACVLLRYPLYWDWTLRGYTTCEAVLNRVLEERVRIERSGDLARLQKGYIRRQFRKLGVVLRAHCR